MKRKIWDIASLAVSLVFWISLGMAYYDFHINCGGHLARAATANSIRLAKQELDDAFLYMDAHHLNSGNTSVFLNTPANDLAFWYNNLGDARAELSKAGANDGITSLEVSNILLKLHETLTTSNGNNRLPEHLAIYPHQCLWMFGLICCLLADLEIIALRIGDD